MTFGYTLGSPDTLTVNVYSSASCSNICDAYDWDWGDGTAHGAGVTASHHFSTAGPKAITLTVEDYGVGEASATRIVTVYTSDLAPHALGTACGSILHEDWSASLTDSSTDDTTVAQVTVNWGDGSMLSIGGQGDTFNHLYRGPGIYKITHKALDLIGQQDTRTCWVTVAYFTISGTVHRSDATTNVVGATVKVKDATTGAVVKTTWTALDGTFSAGGLRPGSYKLSVTRALHTFADPATGTITVGPSSAGNNINALSP